jgi:hypothetical protein
MNEEIAEKEKQLEQDLAHDAQIPKQHRVGVPSDALADQVVHGPRAPLPEGIELETAIVYLDLTPSWWVKNEPQQTGRGLVEVLKADGLIELRATAASLVVQMHNVPKDAEGMKAFRNELAAKVEACT